MARHRGGVDRGLQIQRRDRHAEIDARAAFDGAVHRGEIRQVALQTSAASRRRASARSSSRRTRARTLWPLASSIPVRLRPMAPMAPAAPVTRIGLSCVDFIIISLA